MNHQPYESWILDDPPNTEEEKQVLEHHIKDCLECSQLQEGWTIAERSLRSSHIQSAPSDFTQRWTADLARRKRELEKKQARTLIIALVSGAIAIGITLGILFLPDLSLISLSAGFISTMFTLFSGIENFWAILFKLAQAVPPSTLIVTIIIVSSWVILACFTLGLSIWKLAFKRGEHK